MKKKISLINITLIILTIVGCSRVANPINVQNYYIEKSITSKLEPKEANYDSRMRAMTLLSYPITKDVQGWNFEVSDETRDSWDLFLKSLKFSSALKTNFESSASAKQNITEIVNVIQSAGESRDQSFKKIVPLKKELAKFDLQMQSVKVEKTPSDLTSFVCYYSKKPIGNKPFDCKLVKDEVNTKEKTADNCRDFLKLKFSSVEESSELSDRISKCNSLQNELEIIKEKSLEVDQKIATEMLVRSAGESVVIDLLQSIEKYQSNLVLIATGATLEKNKDANEPVSTIVIDQNNKITEFKLIIDFGPNLSSGGGKVEYSVEKGNIQNLSFKLESDGVWTLRFDLITADFTVKATLAYSHHDVLGRRFVGDAYFYYPNGLLRKGVMKFEFDQISNN